MATTTSQDTRTPSSTDGVGDLLIKRPITITLALALFIGVLLPVCAIVGVMYYTTDVGVHQISLAAEAELKDRAFDHLVAVRDIKKDQIESYFREVARDIENEASNPFLLEAFLEMDAAADAVASRSLTGKDFLKDREYKALYDKYAVTLSDYAEKFGVDDVLFACAGHGDVSFTVAQGSDFGVRIARDLPNSPLGYAWRKALDKGATAFSDVGIYEPAGGTPAQFAATPINEQGTTVEVLLFRLSPAELSDIMGARTGMGATGETILVGSDYLMRSDSFRDPTNHSVLASFRNPSSGRVDTVASRGVHEEGTSGTVLIKDYLGNDVAVAFTPIQAGNTTWALMAKIDRAEAFAAVAHVEQIGNSTERTLTIWAAGLSGLCLLSVSLGGYGFTGP